MHCINTFRAIHGDHRELKCIQSRAIHGERRYLVYLAAPVSSAPQAFRGCYFPRSRWVGCASDVIRRFVATSASCLTRKQNWLYHPFALYRSICARMTIRKQRKLRTRVLRLLFFSTMGRAMDSPVNRWTLIRDRMDHLSSVDNLKGKISVHRWREM